MNALEHLLVCITEECAEVIHAADKALRFGLDDGRPGSGTTNQLDLARELTDLYAAVELLVESGVALPQLGDRAAIDAKKAKILRFMRYAEGRGTLVPPADAS